LEIDLEEYVVGDLDFQLRPNLVMYEEDELEVSFYIR
jgi:hypothetical protein